MTDLVVTNNGLGAQKFRNFFRARDIFLHDGQALRRITLTAPVQFLAALATMLLVAWSVFASVQLANADDGDAHVHVVLVDDAVAVELRVHHREGLERLAGGLALCRTAPPRRGARVAETPYS